MILKKILRNLNILNILLLVVIASFTVYSVFPTLRMQAKYALPPAKPAESAIADKETHELAIPSLGDYMSIVDANLFHPERRIPPVKVEAPPLPKPDFVLYGTMVSDDLSIAYLEDLKAPRNTPGRGKRQVALKKGDSLSGFILKEIETDKIVMVRGEERLIVAMNDPQKPKVRESVTTPTAPAQPAQPKPATTPTSGQSRRESRAAAAAVQQPPAVSQPQTPTQILSDQSSGNASRRVVNPSIVPSAPGSGIKNTPRDATTTALPPPDHEKDITPGGFLRFR